MKKLLPLVALAALVAPALHAQNSMPELTEDEWWQKEGFFFVQGEYVQLDDLQGGGFSFGGEYVNSSVHFGIGVAMAFDFLYNHYSKGEDVFDVKNEVGCDVDDIVWGMDIYIPFRVSNEITLYGGAGFRFNNLTIDTKDWQETRWEVMNGADKSLTSVFFGGGRWRLLDHVYAFAEYRRVSGDVEVNYDAVYPYGRQELKVDMSSNSFLVGLGVTF